MFRLAGIAFVAVAATAAAQPPPPAPPLSVPGYLAREDPRYVSFGCEGGFVLFAASDAPHETLRFWLDDEPLVREATFSPDSAAFVVEGYRADWGGRGTYVKRDGRRVRDHCVPGEPVPTQRLIDRDGLHLALAWERPKPLTTLMRPQSGGQRLWIGETVLRLDAVTVDSVITREGVGIHGRAFVVSEVDLAPEAAESLREWVHEHWWHHVAILVDGTLVRSIPANTIDAEWGGVYLPLESEAVRAILRRTRAN